MRRYLIILFTLITGLSACTKKELPPPVEGEPAIWLKCKLNGFPFELKAGDNAVYAFSATFDNVLNRNERKFVFAMSAPDLKKAFEIHINNYNDTVGDVLDDLNKTIHTGLYKFSYSNAFPHVPFKPKEIEMAYIDYENNDEYYTSPYYQYQASQTTFEIVSVKDVEDNGKKYKLAEIKFGCKVVCVDKGYQYVVTDGHASIPFGY